MEDKKAARRPSTRPSKPAISLSHAAWTQKCKGASIDLLLVNSAGRVMENASHEVECDFEPGYKYDPFVSLTEEAAALIYAALQDRFEPELSAGRKVIGGEVVRSSLPGKAKLEPVTDGERAAINVALKAKDDHIADLRRHIAYITETAVTTGPDSINFEELLGPGTPLTRNSGNF